MPGRCLDTLLELTAGPADPEIRVAFGVLDSWIMIAEEGPEEREAANPSAESSEESE